MKLCRYDDDRLGVVRGNIVHDVTEAQTQIRAAAPYAMKGDAVIAALPAWRSRIEAMADKAPGKPVSSVKLLSPVARPTKLVAAPTNYKAHIEEMRERQAQPGAVQTPFSPFIEKAGPVPEGELLDGRPVGRRRNPLPGPAQRARGRTVHRVRQGGQRHFSG